MPACSLCGIWTGGRPGDLCPACHVNQHAAAFGNRPRPTIPVTRAPEVPIEVTATVFTGVDRATGPDRTGLAIVRGAKVEILSEGEKIGEAKLIEPPKIRRRTRYDIISSGNEELGVHSDEDSDVEDP